MGCKSYKEDMAENGKIEFRFLTPEAFPLQPDGVEWPSDSLVLAAFEGEKVVGRSAIISLPHIEGTWVDDEHRGTTLAFRLVKMLETCLEQLGRTHTFAFVAESQPDVAELVERVGYKRMPLVVYAKELKCQ